MPNLDWKAEVARQQNCRIRILKAASCSRGLDLFCPEPDLRPVPGRLCDRQWPRSWRPAMLADLLLPSRYGGAT